MPIVSMTFQLIVLNSANNGVSVHSSAECIFVDKKKIYGAPKDYQHTPYMNRVIQDEECDEIMSRLSQ